MPTKLAAAAGSVLIAIAVLDPAPWHAGYRVPILALGLWLVTATR